MASSGNGSSMLDLLSNNRLSASLKSLAPKLDAELDSAIEHHPGVTILFLCLVAGLLFGYLFYLLVRWYVSRKGGKHLGQASTVQKGDISGGGGHVQDKSDPEKGDASKGTVRDVIDHVQADAAPEGQAEGLDRDTAQSLGVSKGSASNGLDSACEENSARDAAAVEGKVITGRKLRFSDSHTSHHFFTKADDESKLFDPAEAKYGDAGYAMSEVDLERRSRAASNVSECSGVTGVSETFDVWGKR